MFVYLGGQRLSTGLLLQMGRFPFGTLELVRKQERTQNPWCCNHRVLRDKKQKIDCCTTKARRQTTEGSVRLLQPTVSAILSSGHNVHIIIYVMIIISDEPESAFAVL